MDDSTGLTAIDRALAEALDVDVSPDFAARVRQRIAQEPKPVPFWSGRRLASAAVAAAVLVAAIGGATLSRRGPSAPPLLTARSLSVGAMHPGDVRPFEPALAATSPRRASRTRVAPVAALAANEPDVIVPREEIEMYRRLIAAANLPHALLVDSPKDIVAAGLISEISIDPIKSIDPIRIDLIVPPAGGEGDRQ